MNDLNAAYWNNLYANRETRWDVGTITTPLKAFFDQLTNKEASVLIPGCGNSYEAAYLLENGFQSVTVIDIAPLLTGRLREKYQAYIPQQLNVITGDFFALEGQFDYIIEQTFFCALEPGLRPAYVKKMHTLLKPGGKLAGVLFNRAFEGGPPFGGDQAIYEQLFAPAFDILTLEPCYNSIAPRAGTELFMLMQKRSL